MRQVTTRTHQVHWEERLYPGLSVPAVPPEARSALSQALGRLGVEAEHFLDVVTGFTQGGAAAPAGRAMGDAFLWQLDASARRLAADADTFELASQAYLTALESADPGVRAPGAAGGASGNTPAEPWWPAHGVAVPVAEPLELSLRRCGYAYRHVVAAQLTTNVEAIGEYLALVLHALRTLAPAGVLPLPTLYAGLYELTATLQGHIVPHHLSDPTPQRRGLISGIALLRQLDATEDRSIAADLAWAKEQLAELEQMAATLPGATPVVQRPSGWRDLAGIFRREPARRVDGSHRPVTPRDWAEDAERQWRETIAALEAMRATPQPGAPPVSPR